MVNVVNGTVNLFIHIFVLEKNGYQMGHYESQQSDEIVTGCGITHWKWFLYAKKVAPILFLFKKIHGMDLTI
jgi:hypothetical protein